MRENRTLAALQNNMPNYEDTRKLFMEIYPLVIRMGGPNYVAMSVYNILMPNPSDLLAIYLSGVAEAKASALSEQGHDYWSPLDAWGLVQNDLEEILPDLPRLPAPAEVVIPPKRRRRA